MSNERRPISPPSTNQCHGWISALNDLMSDMQSQNVYGDVGTVIRRVSDAAERGITIQGGCATRLMRIWKSFDDTDADEITDGVYKLAREIIQHENMPDPCWLEMLSDFGLPADPTGTEND